MRFSRLATAGIGLAAAGAVALAGGGEASAALLPLSYPHQASLANGKLSVKVTNDTSKTAKCWLSVHDATKESQLDLRAAAVNAIPVTGIESGVLDSARADAREGALHILANGVSVSKGGSTTKTWDSGRTETSYAIYQECTTPDPLTGLTVNGYARAYRVTGTGRAPDVPGGGGSTGSLENIFGGLF